MMADGGRWAYRLGVVTALLLPVAVTAQDPLGSPVRERVAEVRAHLMARAELGVVLGEVETVAGRTGVRVAEALPGRPAAEAGVQAGDLLVSLDGEALGAQPARRLREVMAGVEPGDTLAVGLIRDGTEQTVRVVAGRSRLVPLEIRALPRLPRPGVDPGPPLAEALREFRFGAGPLARHRPELVDMNPGLGRYFGTGEGVLVANIAPESTLGLEPGDVILSIGGRAVRDAAHARSILASYRADEPVEMQVMRERRRITVRGSARPAPS
jgi:serine protease Do